MLVQLYCSSENLYSENSRPASLFRTGRLYEGFLQWVKRKILFVFTAYGKFQQHCSNSSVFFLICVHLYVKDVEYAGYGNAVTIVITRISSSLTPYISTVKDRTRTYKITMNESLLHVTSANTSIEKPDPRTCEPPVQSCTRSYSPCLKSLHSARYLTC